MTANGFVSAERIHIIHKKYNDEFTGSGYFMDTLCLQVKGDIKLIRNCLDA